MRQIVLLRGINIGPRNRIAMPALRGALAVAEYDDVRTYVQSGNVVLRSDRKPGELADEVQRLIAEHFELAIDVVVRTRDELAGAIARDPIPGAADDPKRYQITFLSDALDGPAIERLAALATEDEAFHAAGRELYAWHREGIARSKLSVAMAARGLGVKATARNWTTVTALLAMADE